MIPIRFVLAQMVSRLGDFEGNVSKIIEQYQRACAERARFVLTPELSVCGYPPQDWVQMPEWVERCDAAVQRLLEVTQGQTTALIVGHVFRSDGPRGLHNGVSVLQGGRIVFRQAKTLLPTYDVFDEGRYFDPAPEVALWDCDGAGVALAICEDLWSSSDQDPVGRYAQLGARLVLSASASPWEWGKREQRLAVHQEAARRCQAPLAYCSMVAASDEVLFDGSSFAITASGKNVIQAGSFAEAWVVLDWDPSTGKLAAATGTEPQVSEDDWDIVRQGLRFGVREYFERTGFKKAILGLSGGIDSAVVACIAVEALGAENVRGVAMPGPFSSSHSLTDAEELAVRLGIGFEVRPIKFLYQAASREWGEARGGLSEIARENLQARLRGMLLMTLSNHDGSLVLTTGNKSEIAVGYCTLYGDMVGALGPIGDLFKTEVYIFARRFFGELIPQSTLTKPPSAELRAGQTDQDSLPPYAELDAFIRDWWVEGKPLESASVGRQWAARISQMMLSQEFKRAQAAPLLRVSKKAFGIGRRVPIAKIWR